jgi:hypothetical protein
VIGPLTPIRLGVRAGRRVGDAAATYAVGVGFATLDAVVERAARHLLEEGELERIVAGALESPAVDRVAEQIVDSASAERLVVRIIESRLLDEAVARLLESKDLWILVDEIARSPSVTEAIAHQSAGVADEMGAVVRQRSRVADDRLERIARRIVGR